MEPLFFNEHNNRLFGVFHEAKGYDTNIGIIMCYPLGYEYQRSHRTFYTLSEQLSNEGFDVLRFDFSGCGDSAGYLNEANLDLWINDIVAAKEMMENSKAYSKIVLVGNRMGATLAFMASNSRLTDIKNIVLWDPILNGHIYLNQLQNAHEKWLVQSFSLHNSNATNEFIGYKVEEPLLSAIKNINLTDTGKINIQKVLYIETGPDIEDNMFKKYLQNNIEKYTYSHLLGNQNWDKMKDEDNQYMVQLNVVEKIVDWIKEVL